MLVMITIFISKMEGLPPTSDTKMIDYWLILCQLVPFAEVVLLTAMEYIREEDINALNTNHKGRVRRVEVAMYEGATEHEDDESPQQVELAADNKRRLSVTCLKTIGKERCDQNKFVSLPREEGAAWVCSGRLSSVLLCSCQFLP